MAIESHIESLVERHQELEGLLHEKQKLPSVDNTEIIELKRQKLVLKDTIERLRTENQSLH